MTTFNGFSTYNRSKKYRLSDFELVKQDLFNHLHIRKGEKLMAPNFGTIIWGLLFEPLTPEIKIAIQKDLTDIINYDPRISAESINLTEYAYGIQVIIELRYISTNQVDLLKINFDRGTG